MRLLNSAVILRTISWDFNQITYCLAWWIMLRPSFSSLDVVCHSVQEWMWFIELMLFLSQAVNMETSRSRRRTRDNTESFRQTAGENTTQFFYFSSKLLQYLFCYLHQMQNVLLFNLFNPAGKQMICYYSFLLFHTILLYLLYICTCTVIYWHAVTLPTFLSGLHFPEVSGHPVPLWWPAFHQ